VLFLQHTLANGQPRHSYQPQIRFSHSPIGIKLFFLKILTLLNKQHYTHIALTSRKMSGRSRYSTRAVIIVMLKSPTVALLEVV